MADLADLPDLPAQPAPPAPPSEPPPEAATQPEQASEEPAPKPFVTLDNIHPALRPPHVI